MGNTNGNMVYKTSIPLAIQYVYVKGITKLLIENGHRDITLLLRMWLESHLCIFAVLFIGKLKITIKVSSEHFRNN